MAEVFEQAKAAASTRIGQALYLEDGPYANPYDLMTFYDNHDMARMDASDEGFIDANNWLFTARGIPVDLLRLGNRLHARHAPSTPATATTTARNASTLRADSRIYRQLAAHRQPARAIAGAAARPAGRLR